MEVRKILVLVLILSVMAGAGAAQDTDSPLWRNLQDNSTSPDSLEIGEAVNISAQWKDGGSGLTKVVLATTESGSFENKTGNFNISRAEKIGGIASEGSGASGVTWNNDGSKMFVIDAETNKIYEYSCSTSFDLSTCTLQDSIPAQDNAGAGIAWNDVGDKLYEVDWAAVKIYEYSCSTSFDLSTCTSQDSKDAQASPRGITWNNDGSKMFVVDSDNDVFYEYSCSTSFDLSTCTLQDSKSTQDSSPEDLAWNDDGKKLYENGDSSDKIYEYGCSTVFDLSTCTFQQEISSSGQPTGITWNNDGSKMFTSDGSSTISAYRVALYGSPQFFNAQINVWNQTDFIWKNSSFKETLDYRIWGRDAAGNWNVTDTGAFSITEDFVEGFQQGVSFMDSTGVNASYSLGEKESLEAATKTGEKASFSDGEQESATVTTKTQDRPNTSFNIGEKQEQSVIDTVATNTFQSLGVTQTFSVTDVFSALAGFAEGFQDSATVSTTTSTSEEITVSSIRVYNQTYNREGRINVRQGIHVRVNVTHPDGRENIDQVRLNLTDPNDNRELDTGKMTPVDNNSIGDREGRMFEFNFSMPTSSTDGGEWTVNVTANDTSGEVKRGGYTFIYQVFSISEGSPSQGDAEIEKKTLFTETDQIVNPSDVAYADAKAILGIFKDTASKNDVDLTDPSDNPATIDSIRIPTGEINFTISSAGSSYDKTWELEYNTTAVNTSTRNTTTVISGKDVWIKEVNMSNNITTINDVFAKSGIFEPEDAISVKLLKGGTDVTLDEDFNVDIPDNLSFIKFTEPDLSKKENFTIRASRGKAVKVDVEDVLKTAPATSGTTLRWRRCIRAENPNDFSVDWSRKERVPDATDFRLEDGCSTDFDDDLPGEDTRFDNKGEYIPLDKNLPGESNNTFGIWFQTDSFDETPARFDRPNKKFVDEDMDVTMEKTVNSESPIDINTSSQLQIEAPIQYGEETKVFEDGEEIRDIGLVEEGHVFNFSNLSKDESRTFVFDYDVPTGESELFYNGSSDAGNSLKVYEIRSLAPYPLENVRLYLEDVDHVNLVNVTEVDRKGPTNFEFEKELEIEGGRRLGPFRISSTQVKLGNLPTKSESDPIFVKVEYRKGNPAYTKSPEETRDFFARWLGRTGVLLIFLPGLYLAQRRFKLLRRLEGGI